MSTFNVALGIASALVASTQESTTGWLGWILLGACNFDRAVDAYRKRASKEKL